MGYALGSSMGRTPLLYGKRIEFTAEEPEIEAAPMDIKDKMSPKQIESSTNKVEASQDVSKDQRSSQQSPKQKQKQKG